MKFILIMLLASFVSGCVIIPTPHVYVDGSRHNVTQESIKCIRPKNDTIEDVFLKLGEPDSISADERQMTYDSKKLELLAFIFMVDTDGSDLPQISNYRHFIVLLDTNSLVAGTYNFSRRN